MLIHQECSTNLYNRLIIRFPQHFSYEILGNIAYKFNVFIDTDNDQIFSEELLEWHSFINSHYGVSNISNTAHIYQYLISIFHEKIITKDTNIYFDAKKSQLFQEMEPKRLYPVEYSEVSMLDTSINYKRKTYVQNTNTIEPNIRRKIKRRKIITIVPVYGRFDADFVKCDENKNKMIASFLQTKEMRYYPGQIGTIANRPHWFASAAFLTRRNLNTRKTYPRPTIIFMNENQRLTTFQHIILDQDCYTTNHLDNTVFDDPRNDRMAPRLLHIYHSKDFPNANCEYCSDIDDYNFDGGPDDDREIQFRISMSTKRWLPIKKQKTKEIILDEMEDNSNNKNKRQGSGVVEDDSDPPTKKLRINSKVIVQIIDDDDDEPLINRNNIQFDQDEIIVIDDD